MVPADQQIAVQRAAKQVLAEISDCISVRSTERSIASFATERLQELGYSEAWYYSCPALVLLGSRSCLSVSGREYQPSTETVGNTNLVTVDLSPCREWCWGDCARSFVVESGRVVRAPGGTEFQRGLAFVEELHHRVRDFVTPQTTFGGLFDFANQQIASEGFENLDFHGNVGHSIATALADREFIETGNCRPLATVQYFTFEPHIRETDGPWGFKHENIYYFNREGRLEEL